MTGGFMPAPKQWREGTLLREGEEVDSHAELAAVASRIGHALQARAVRIVDRAPHFARDEPLAGWADDHAPAASDGEEDADAGSAGQDAVPLFRCLDGSDGPWVIAEPRSGLGFDAEAMSALDRAMDDDRWRIRAAWAQARLERMEAVASSGRMTAFLLAWCDEMRGVDDPDLIVTQTLARVGTQIGAARVCYREGGAVLHDWTGEATAAVSAGTLRSGDADDRPMLIAEGSDAQVWQPDAAALLEAVAVRLGPMVAHAREQRRRAEGEALLSAFMERAPLGIFVKDAQGRFVRANPELAAAFDIPLDHLIGHRASDVVDGAIADRLAAIDEEVRHGATAGVELVDPDRDDHSTVLVVSFPLPGAGESNIGGFTIDLTERKRAEAALSASREALHQSEKLSALGSLLAGVSHELNNPLSIVTAQADLILHEAGADGPIGMRAAKLREAAERCARIVRTFLAMARREPPERRPVAVDPMVDAAIDLLGYGLTSHGIAIERHAEPDLPDVEADPDQLHQIVVNLLVNAQQALAGRADARIAVRTWSEGDQVIVEVGDNGPGIPAEVRRRIFDPFFTTKPQGQGTGMGLAFSQGLAEAHGGSLILSDLRTGDSGGGEDGGGEGGGGAVFRLSLPARRSAIRAEPPSRTPVHRVPHGLGRALLAVDTRATGDAIAAMLHLEGYRSQIVTGGTAAQALLGTGSFDLIVAEVRMAGVDGLALYRWIQRIRPDLIRRIVFVSAEPRHAATMAPMFESAAPHIGRPVMPLALREALATIDAAR